MPAGLPCGKPGNGLLMEGAVQQAAQRGRQVAGVVLRETGGMHLIVGPGL